MEVMGDAPFLHSPFDRSPFSESPADTAAVSGQNHSKPAEGASGLAYTPEEAEQKSRHLENLVAELKSEVTRLKQQADHADAHGNDPLAALRRQSSSQEARSLQEILQASAGSYMSPFEQAIR